MVWAALVEELIGIAKFVFWDNLKKLNKPMIQIKLVCVVVQQLKKVNFTWRNANIPGRCIVQKQ